MELNWSKLRIISRKKSVKSIIFKYVENSMDLINNVLTFGHQVAMFENVTFF